MKKDLVALLLLQVAAGIIGEAVGVEYGSSAGLWTQCVIGTLAAAAWIGVCLGEYRQRRAIRHHPEHELNQSAYHRDVVAVAYGEMDEEEFDRKWAGRVPPSPRQTPRRTRQMSSYVRDYIWPVTLVPDHKIELFKEIMTDPQYAPDKKESHRAPLYRLGGYVRWHGELWKVVNIVGCYGPNETFWWGYYVERDGHSIHPFESELIEALPRAGEWWESAPCEKHPESYPARQITVDMDSTYLESVWVRCGCLVPINFGRGR